MLGTPLRPVCASTYGRATGDTTCLGRSGSADEVRQEETGAAPLGEICGGFAAWAQGFVRVALDHMLSPVERIGAIAWLALVALRDEEHAA